MEGDSVKEEEKQNASSFQLQKISPIKKITLVASIAAGVQFGWALQLSLLTPYIQLLGIPHKWSALIWLCGPVSGLLVQPIVGYYSDRCKSRFGRRRPFIAAGAGLVCLAVILIGFAADFGHLFGDDPKQVPKTRAIVVFVVGFWILDVANNMLGGPCRAFLADISGDNQRMTSTANALFSFFMAVGNILGYGAGSYTHMYKVFPFTRTNACDVYCANLKSCFFISIALLLALTTVALTIVKEPEQMKPDDGDDDGEEKKVPFFREIFTAFRELQRPMRILLIVTFLNWFAWFPWVLFDTDWMGREVYGGEVGKGKMYDRGVRAGALGLLLNSIVLGIASLGIESIARVLGGVKKLWGTVNFLLAFCLGMTVLITKLAESSRHDSPPVLGGGAIPSTGIKVGAFLLFAALGIPLAATYSIPFALASIFSNSSGAGQGLSLGVLNLAIVIPQMIISFTSGPFDALFGGGNLPAFIVGAFAAALSGVLAFTMLPSPPPDIKISTSGGTH